MRSGVIASRLGGREAVREGALGQLVDPTNPAEIRLAIIDALASGEQRIPAGLDHFRHANFGCADAKRSKHEPKA